jgi:hypothetical protein
MTMAKLHPNHRKHVQNIKAQMQQAHRLAFKKRSEPLIPDEVLRKLASLGLPNSEWIYDACLRKAIAEYMAKGA